MREAKACADLQRRGARLRNGAAIFSRREWTHPSAMTFKRMLFKISRGAGYDDCSHFDFHTEDIVSDSSLELCRVLIMLTTITSLQLDLRDKKTITGESLKATLPTTLTSLQLDLKYNTNIIDEGLKAALTCTLTSLQLNLTDKTTITDEGLKAALPSTLTSLQLDFNDNTAITGEGLKVAFPTTLTSLHLNLSSNTTITDARVPCPTHSHLLCECRNNCR